jgi:Flp pilus assembly protein TadG
MRISRKNRKESGTAALEFALVAMPIIFTLIGVVVVGINLARSIQVGQICRDADSMYVRGVDFSQTAAQNLLAQMGQNINLQTGSSSSGLIILSQVQYVPTPIGCTGSACSGGSYKLVQQQIIGNTSLPGTHFPTAGSIPACTGSLVTDCQDSQGNIEGYETYANATISNFGSSLTLGNNELSYVAEAEFESGANLNWFSNSGFYAQAFF